MHQIQAMRGGRDNDPDFTTRMCGTGVEAELLRLRFAKACKRLGINQTRITLRNDLFRPPQGAQLRLF